MISKKILLTMYEYSYFLASQGIDSFNHQDSLANSPGSANPANWILGHIITSRSNVLAMLGLDPPWDFERCKSYLPDSEPLSPSSSIEDFEEMKIILAQTQEILLDTIRNITEEELNTTSGENSLGEELAGYAIHEAYHTGELNTINPLLG